jgi:AraC-like DNA-binding protein
VNVWLPFSTTVLAQALKHALAVAYTASMVLLDEAGLGRSATRIVLAGRLTTFVEHFWIHDGPHPRDRWRIVPDSSGYVIFSGCNRAAGVETQLFIVGARSRYVDIDTSGRYLTVAARLRPGALAILTGVRASELIDRSVQLAELTGHSAGELLDRMSTATPVDAQRQMATFLSRRFRCGADPDLLSLGRLLTRTSTVATLAAAIDLGKRSLYERSRESIGLAPKRALRIARLHRALWLAVSRQPWSAVAAAAGYADQAHLTRDMQALLGEGPTDWARRGRLSDSFKTGSGEKR